MHTPRANHSATLLPNGKVLIAGGFSGSGGEPNPYATTELYDPRTGTFTPGGNMSIGRSGHTATLLKNGKVLIVGGWTGHYNVRNSAELYDPAANEFTPTGNLVIERAGSRATLLPDGRVLVTGGADRHEDGLASAEIYDPATEKFTLTGSMREPRTEHTATALQNGQVLVVGGGSGDHRGAVIYREAELFDPTTGIFSPAGLTNVPRHKHAAILLASGNVLVAGGSDNGDWHGQYSSAEIYDPVRNAFAATDSMRAVRFKLPFAVTLLPNGKALVAGGGSFAELFDERTGSFIQVPGSLGTARYFSSATALPGGQVLITGGYYDSGAGLPATESSWLYRPAAEARNSD